MSESKKSLNSLSYASKNEELHEELLAIKKASGAKRVELSRALVRRFCDFQYDLSQVGDFCGEMGLSQELSDFIFAGLRAWSEGGSIESAVSVDSKPGRPAQTERNRIIFSDVRSRVMLGWDVHAACYATADALGAGEVDGLEKHSLSPSSIRRIYYSVLKEPEFEHLNENPEEITDEIKSIVGSSLATETLQRANQGNWPETIAVLEHIYEVGDRALTNKYMNMVGRIAGMDVDCLRYYQTLIKKIIDGKSPNEAFRYDVKP